MSMILDSFMVEKNPYLKRIFSKILFWPLKQAYLVASCCLKYMLFLVSCYGIITCFSGNFKLDLDIYGSFKLSSAFFALFPSFIMTPKKWDEAGE